MTFSIVARCPKTGMLGVATATASLAVGNRVPHLERNVGAIATQANTRIEYGIKGLKLLRIGFSPQTALNALLAEDSERETRQVIIIDFKGRTAAFTGEQTLDWKGHIIGENYVVAGNLLVSNNVVEAAATVFEDSRGERLAERLLKALEAGQRAGGDRRGKASAALKVAGDENITIDLRVDLHQNPVKELRKLYEQYEKWLRQSL